MNKSRAARGSFLNDYTSSLLRRKRFEPPQELFFEREIPMKNRFWFFTVGIKRLRFTIQQLQGGGSTVRSEDGVSSLRASFKQRSTSANNTDRLRGSRPPPRERESVRSSGEMNLSRRCSSWVAHNGKKENEKASTYVWTFIWERKKRKATDLKTGSKHSAPRGQRPPPPGPPEKPRSNLFF